MTWTNVRLCPTTTGEHLTLATQSRSTRNFSGLMPDEEYLFHRYLHRGNAILDLGVGAGRTTPYLSAVAGRYIGVDYSPTMIEVCRRRFPDTEFRQLDVRNMSCFKSGSFDAIVFSYNGLDTLCPLQDRNGAVREIVRCLRQDGIFIFSANNPRKLVYKPTWAARLPVAKRMFAYVYATAMGVYRRVPTLAFWRGEGYITEHVHGGLTLYMATPDRIRSGLRPFNLDVIEAVSSDYPAAFHPFLASWCSYACRRRVSLPPLVGTRRGNDR